MDANVVHYFPDPLEQLRVIQKWFAHLNPVAAKLPRVAKQTRRVSEGPHSATSWVNMIGVPAVVVPAGFYPSGLPFGLEFSARPWTDGDLLAVAYAWEQATHLRKPPVLVERGLLPVRPASEGRR